MSIDPTTELIGSTLSDRYRIERLLGRGGMAEVYLAFDTGRAAHLALKLLHEDLAQDPVFIRRFQREAHNLARLQHPNVVRFYGLEQDDLLAFILMDYIEGSTLRAEIVRSQGRGMSPARILEIMQPVCSALHYAHQMGLVHCDIKPANIMLHKNGSILVADFGIARMTETATTTLVGLGTPAYMPPEQARGLDPSPQSDQYSLGVVLFEMLSGGERPFTGEHARTTGSTSEKVRWEQINLPPPSICQIKPSVPAAVDQVVLRCLQKDPRQRFPNILEMYQALESAFYTRQAVQLAPLPVYEREAPTELHQTPRQVEVTPSAASPAQGQSRHNRRAIAGVVILGLLLLVAAGAFTLLGNRTLPDSLAQEPTPALSAGISPTATQQVNIPPLVNEYLSNVQVQHTDYFDGRLEDTWAGTNASQSGSMMTVEGVEYWAASAVLRQSISEGQGVYLLHQFSQDSEFEIHLQNGVWSEVYRRFGFYGGETPQANLFWGAEMLGNGYLPGNFAPLPGTWYYTFLAVDPQANFMAVIWEPSNPSNYIYYRETLGTKWDDLQWEFVISANKGTINVDDVILFSFDGFKR
jgi:serine/threonine protein kinase